MPSVATICRRFAAFPIWREPSIVALTPLAMDMPPLPASGSAFSYAVTGRTPRYAERSRGF